MEQGADNHRVDKLVLALKDRDPWNEQAAEDLFDLGDSAPVPALIEALSDPGRSVAERAASALGRLGPQAEPAVPALIGMLRRGNVHDRYPLRILGPCREAILGLKGIGAAAVPDLITALQDPDEHVRFKAANALGEIGPAATAAIPALREVLKDKERWVRCEAADALRNLGPDAEAALPALADARADPDPFVRIVAELALATIQPTHPRCFRQAVRTLVKALKDRDALLRAKAAQTLGRLGSEARAAVPALLRKRNLITVAFVLLGTRFDR